jgi:hypothetical protein
MICPAGIQRDAAGDCSEGFAVKFRGLVGFVP